MRYLFLIFFILSFNIVSSQIPDGYYDGTDNLDGSELKTKLYQIIKGHQEFPYTSSNTDVWDILKETDKDTNNTDNVILLYTGWSVNGEQEYNSGNGWSREHVWAKSHGDFGTTMGAGTDVHHLRPCDISVNSARSNRWFAECTEQYYDGDTPTDSWTSSTNWYWKPRDEVKGDVARMIFYMATRYEGENGEPDLEVIDTIPSDNNTPLPIHAKLSDLYLWHKQDPVDELERTRNNIIYSDYQNNRNPFIDHPEFVKKIWIDSVTEEYKINLASNPSEGGSVSGDGTYKKGNEVTITATSNSGYKFDHWTEDGEEISTDSVYTFIVDTAHNFTANFDVASKLNSHKNENIKIYPNPSNNHIRISGVHEADFKVEIIDLNGRKIYDKHFINNNPLIDLSGYKEGIYFIKIITNDGINYRKVLKK
jgi:endonuclease I